MSRRGMTRTFTMSSAHRRMRGVPDHHLPGFDVLHDYGPRANDRPLGNRDRLTDRRASSDVGTVTDANGTGQSRSRGDMYVVADTAVVLDDGATVDDHVHTEFGTRID